MATTFQKDNFGRGDVVMIADYGSYEGQVVLLAGLLIGAVVAALDCTLKKSNRFFFLLFQKAKYFSVVFILHEFICTQKLWQRSSTNRNPT